MKAFCLAVRQFLFDDDNSFPPKLACREVIVSVFIFVSLILDVIYLGLQFCQVEWGIIEINSYGTYLGLAYMLLILVVSRSIEQRLIVHGARLVDKSVVDSIIVEAETIGERFKTKDGKIKPDKYDSKKEDIQDEIKRLQGIGNLGWTEYQVLSLNQMLVDFLKIDELKARAISSLDDLLEFADDFASRYDRDHYVEWKRRIDEAIKKIGECENEDDCDKKAEGLRGELRTLLEHVANYTQYWAQGSAHREALTTIGVLSIPILLLIGLLPMLRLDPTVALRLGVLNWSALGVCGAIAAVLRDLKKLDIVEVGNTEGKRELWQAILGAALGLLAGVLSYAMIGGGLLSGLIVPTVDSDAFEDICLSIVWAISSGVCFEAIFNKVRSSTLGDA